jgi:hypothetical protein
MKVTVAPSRCLDIEAARCRGENERARALFALDDATAAIKRITVDLEDKYCLPMSFMDDLA